MNETYLLIALALVGTIGAGAILHNLILRNALTNVLSSQHFITNSGFVFAVRALLRLKDLKEQIEKGDATEFDKDFYERNKEAHWKNVRAYSDKLIEIEHGSATEARTNWWEHT